MRKITFFAAFVFISLFEIVSAQSLVHSFLFDFGPTDTTNGVATTNPDANNNSWNIITTATGTGGTSLTSSTPAFTNLIDTGGIVSAYGLTFVQGSFSTNGILNGGLLAPDFANFGTNTELAIATATEDYMFSAANSGTATSSVPTFKITGLDVTRKYKFKIFGSRSGTAVKTSQYTLQGDGSAVVGTLNTSDASGGNLGNVYVSDYVVPNASGEISIAVMSAISTSGYYAYVNCMKMEEYSITTGIDKKKKDNVLVYPTASTSSVFVTGAKESVELYNLSGSKVLESKKSQSNKIDITSLSNGVYMLIVDGYKCFKITKI